ncbi:ATP-binding protein [Candidatus Poriferisocius sp.]|uniref:ATP-binding protein n=1 Tax=Candidatus Poriferisocius sp. TaxID=3101276 RepID=UPI003B029B2A
MILNRLDSSSKQPLKAIRPVHHDAGPEVEVEISSGSYRFKYFKRWHRQPETTLEVIAPRREQLTGREAHERVEAILAETLDQDLWKALTIEQGTEPGLPEFGVPSLGLALDLAAGGTQAANSDDALWERICTERLRYWTGTGRESQERKLLANGVDQAHGRIDDLNAQLSAIEDDAAEAARLAGQEGDLAVRLDEAGKAVTILSEQWEATESLRNQIERLASDHTTAQAQLKVIDGNMQRRRDLVDAVRDQGRELASLEEEVEQAAPGLALAVQQSEEATMALRAAQDALRLARDKLRLANDDRDYRRNQIEKDQLYERHERVLGAQKGLSIAEAVLDSSQVDDELVDQIEQARDEETRAKIALQASAASVEATALSDLSVLIDGQDFTMDTNAVQRAHVTDDWELVVPDIVQVRVLAGHESQDLATDFETAQQEHARLCALGGVGNLAEAKHKVDERREAERSRDESVKTIQENLRDLTLEGLVQKLDGLIKRVSSYPADRQQAPPLPEDLDEAKKVVSSAENDAAECQDEVDRCESTAETAAEARKQAEVGAALQAGKLKSARDTKKLAEQKLEEARHVQPDRDLEEALSAKETVVQEAATARQQAESELRAQDPDSLKAKLDNARDVKVKAEDALRTNQDRRRDLKGRLEAHGESGLHSRLNVAISEHQHLTRDYQRIESRAQAVHLLHQTFERHRQDARQRYIAPFKEQIEQLGRIVFGPTFEVELDGDLRVAQRTLDGKTLDIEQLSVGAREQIGVISRLACAAIVSPDGGGAPVVIDDALGWSDPSRLQAMGAAIAAAGRDCQVIVLTCTPGRYAHVGNAKVVRLPA